MVVGLAEFLAKRGLASACASDAVPSGFRVANWPLGKEPLAKAPGTMRRFLREVICLRAAAERSLRVLGSVYMSGNPLTMPLEILRAYEEQREMHCWVALQVSSQSCGVPLASNSMPLIRLPLTSAAARPLKGTCVAEPWLQWMGNFAMRSLIHWTFRDREVLADRDATGTRSTRAHHSLQQHHVRVRLFTFAKIVLIARGVGREISLISSRL